MKILVTGATGFIGTYLVPDLARSGYSVIASDIGPEPNWIASQKNVSYVQADMGRDADVYKMMSLARPDKVVHLAALLAEACEADPGKAFQVNLMATQALLDASLAMGVKRFVMVSSPAVFGRGLPEPVADDAAKLPETVYGQTKLACENLLEWYRRKHGLSVGAVRFPWVYGPGRTNGLTATYSSLLLDAIAKGQKVALANADEVGDWLYVKDAVNALNLMLVVDRTKSVAYNIMGSLHSVSDALAITTDLFPDARIEIGNTPKAPYPYPASFDDKNAREELRWKPEYSIEQGIRDHIRSIRMDS